MATRAGGGTKPQMLQPRRLDANVGGFARKKKGAERPPRRTPVCPLVGQILSRVTTPNPVTAPGAPVML